MSARKSAEQVKCDSTISAELRCVNFSECQTLTKRKCRGCKEPICGGCNNEIDTDDAKDADKWGCCEECKGDCAGCNDNVRKSESVVLQFNSGDPLYFCEVCAKSGKKQFARQLDAREDKSLQASSAAASK